MQLTFYGGADTVTGSCFLVDTGQTRILVDCGLFQGPKAIRQRNYESFPFDPESIDFVFLTHAHIDHSGQIPKLIKYGYKGPILCTACTADMCGALLPDSGYIQEMEVERKNRKARRTGQPEVQPIYTVDDAYRCLEYFQPVAIDVKQELIPGIIYRLRDAGHILGAAVIELWVREEGGTDTKIVFSGDLGNRGRPFVRDPENVWDADCLVLESTYGDRKHKEPDEDPAERFKEVIWKTYRKGGNLIIPAFAVERTQDLLYQIFGLMRADELPPMDVYVDSPLAIAITHIFGANHNCYDDEACQLLAAGIDPLGLPHLKMSRTAQESRRLNEIPGGAIILAGSGMCEAGRIRHHLKHNLWRPEATILFVGYQAEGTLGRYLLDGGQKARLFGEEVVVRADIENIRGWSAHADQDMLVDWVKRFRVYPQQLFLVHGEAKAAQALKERLTRETGIIARIPVWKETVTVQSGLEKRQKLTQACHRFWSDLERYLQEENHSYDDVLAKVTEFQQYLARRAEGAKKGD